MWLRRYLCMCFLSAYLFQAPLGPVKFILKQCHLCQGNYRPIHHLSSIFDIKLTLSVKFKINEYNGLPVVANSD